MIFVMESLYLSSRKNHLVWVNVNNALLENLIP